MKERTIIYMYICVYIYIHTHIHTHTHTHTHVCVMATWMYLSLTLERSFGANTAGNRCIFDLRYITVKLMMSLVLPCMYIMQIIKLAIETDTSLSNLNLHKSDIYFLFVMMYTVLILFMPFIIYGFGFHCRYSRYMEKNNIWKRILSVPFISILIRGVCNYSYVNWYESIQQCGKWGILYMKEAAFISIVVGKWDASCCAITISKR
jgi:hypothetical protein